MPEKLKEHLMHASEVRYNEALRLLETISEEEALVDRLPNWPWHEYHVAQDGSIAGIVHHLAAWKHVYVELLHGRNVEVHDVHPEAQGFSGLVEWYRHAGAEWLAECKKIPLSGFQTPITVPGVSAGLTPLDMMREMLEHDIEHLGQINYLVERHRCLKASQ